jgi:UDP-N-acetylmuramyl pentapeptide synthase
MPMIFLENEPFIHIHQTHFSGYHNACNILSASLLALKVGVSRQECQQYLTEITGLEHRIETI